MGAATALKLAAASAAGWLIWGAAASAAPVADVIQATAVVHADRPGAVIDRHVYGQFSEHLGHGIYGGLWVGEASPIPNTRGWRNDVVGALKAIRVPMLRWPGGCFADEYDWREGVGPRDKRPTRVNTNWGGVEEPNTVGTHEYFDLVEQLGTDAYVSGDVGSAPPREMAEWVEYITNDTRSTLAQTRRANGRDKPWRLPYFGIGNETWGCGGNMRPEYAADVTRRYAAFLKAPADQHMQKLASGAHDDDFSYTEVLMREAAKFIDGLTYHYYTVPTGVWEHKGAATGFGEDQYASTLVNALKIDGYIARQETIMDRYDPQKRVALVVDEWGVWTDPTPGTNPGFLEQQNSLRDALAAASTLNIFHAHAERVRMAAIAQTVNVLQAMVLTDGPKMLLTPTYHVFRMYLPFQGATALPASVDAAPYVFGSARLPSVEVSAARGLDGRVHVALVNLDPHRSARVRVALPGVHPLRADGEVLTAPTFDAVNTFAHPDAVRPVAAHAQASADGLTALIPAKSVTVLDVEAQR